MKETFKRVIFTPSIHLNLFIQLHVQPSSTMAADRVQWLLRTERSVGSLPRVTAGPALLFPSAVSWDLLQQCHQSSSAGQQC